MKSKKTRILISALLILLIAALALVYTVFREKTVAGSKSVTITVVSSAAQETVYEVHTDAEVLLGAMQDAAGLSFAGTDGPYGMMISTVNGETADYEIDQSYWSFSVNGTYCSYGVSEQPVHDGDAFTIAYTR